MQPNNNNRDVDGRFVLFGEICRPSSSILCDPSKTKRRRFELLIRIPPFGGGLVDGGGQKDLALRLLLRLPLASRCIFPAHT